MTKRLDPSLLLDDMMTWADDQGITLKLFERADGAWEIVSLALTTESAPGALRAVFVRLARSADERACTLFWAAADKMGEVIAMGIHVGFLPPTAEEPLWKRLPLPLADDTLWRSRLEA